MSDFTDRIKLAAPALWAECESLAPFIHVCDLRDQWPVPTRRRLRLMRPPVVAPHDYRPCTIWMPDGSMFVRCGTDHCTDPIHTTRAALEPVR